MIDASPQRGSEGGFVLVAVLVLLVVLTLLASSVALISQRAVAEARRDAENFEGQVDVASTADTVLFLLASQPMSLAGLTIDDRATGRVVAADDDVDGLSVMPLGNEIRLDNMAYRGLGRSRFSIQDGRGLFSPNFAPAAARIAFYQHMNVPVERQGGLDAKRLDYQDPDDLLRVGGAEAAEYVAAGLPPPPNRPIATPLEFRSVLDWGAMLADRTDADLLGMLTVDRNLVVNINSAPAEVLRLFPGVDAQIAERIVGLRRMTPFVSLTQVRQIVPVLNDDAELLTLFHGNSGNLTLWSESAGRARLFHWTLTPYHDGGRPWRIDYEVALPRDESDPPGAVATPDTPLLAPTDPLGR